MAKIEKDGKDLKMASKDLEIVKILGWQRSEGSKDRKEPKIRR